MTPGMIVAFVAIVLFGLCCVLLGIAWERRNR
jgi:hypothetical protein